jgi:hypothetical protein
MKSNDIVWGVIIVAAGAVIFGVSLFLAGIYDVSIGGNSDAAKFAEWVVNAIR